MESQSSPHVAYSRLNKPSETNNKKLLLILIPIVVLFLLYHSQESLGYAEAPYKPVERKSLLGPHPANHYPFALIADLDRLSKREKVWYSVLQLGTLVHISTVDGKMTLAVHWGDSHEVKTSLAEAGRGMELSELVWFQNRLLSFDDRTGAVFNIQLRDRSWSAVPVDILTAGDGTTAKGQKTEWATEKDGILYVGSFGKEYVNKDGSIAHRNNLWVNKIGACSDFDEREDWTDKYELLREATGTKFPGYMIQEAIHFNPRNRKWYVLPRRVSSEAYDEVADEHMGSNKLIVVNEEFTMVEKVTEVGYKVPERGFSSFKFLQIDDKEVIVALKTVEKEDKDTGAAEQSTFITVFDEHGTLYLDDTPIPGEHKFEGVEFV